jgi:hypothetical protein
MLKLLAPPSSSNAHWRAVCTPAGCSSQVCRAQWQCSIKTPPNNPNPPALTAYAVQYNVCRGAKGKSLGKAEIQGYDPSKERPFLKERVRSFQLFYE